jgi:hypothetical protein
MTDRHPLQQAADKLKRAFMALDFSLVDNSEEPEIEEYDVGFATWAEPEDLFAWQNDPLQMRLGCTVLRTRLLPAQLKRIVRREEPPRSRLLAFGRVYQNNKAQPMHYQIEGLLLNESQSSIAYGEFWDQVALLLCGEGATAKLDLVGDNSYQIHITNSAASETYHLGYTGPASEQTLTACGVPEGIAWVFVINVDEFALEYFSLQDTVDLYANDLKLLKQFPCEDVAAGSSPAYEAIDILRNMGYQETCGAVLYTNEAYKKMNMIQESWDKNNQGYQLVKKLGDYTAVRTVLTPALEEILGYNYMQGLDTVRIFEVGHIYLPDSKKVLPKEHIAVSLAAYGQDLSIESFKQEVTDFLKAMGIEGPDYMPNGMATAYKWNECFIVMHDGRYLKGNFGRISEKAGRNHGIGQPAYMANFELDALVEKRRI